MEIAGASRFKDRRSNSAVHAIKMSLTTVAHKYILQLS